MNWGDTRLPERFWNKVIPEPNSGCWLWTACTVKGYGSFSLRIEGKKKHRYAHQMTFGPVATGLELDHKCRTPLCCNPDHLEAVTHIENINRGQLRNRRKITAAAKTHCKRGHVLFPLKSVPGERRCRECPRDAQRRCQERKKKVQP